MRLGDIIIWSFAVSFFTMVLITVFADEVKLKHFILALIPGVIVSVLLALDLIVLAIIITAVILVIYFIIGIYFERKG